MSVSLSSQNSVFPMLLKGLQSGLVSSHIKILKLKICAKLKKEEKGNMSTNHQQERWADSEGVLDFIFMSSKQYQRQRTNLSHFYPPLCELYNL